MSPDAQDSKDIGQRYGPVEAYCAHCGEPFEVFAGPTKLVDVAHEPDGCGKWSRVHMETGGSCKTPEGMVP